MLSGFYTAASGLLTQQRDLDVIGNNLSNARTPGYRADRTVVSSFERALSVRLEEHGQGGALGGGAPAAVVDEVVSLFEAGDLQDTGRSLDLAVDGNGFFNIQGNDGNIYLTRSGQFDVDEQGYLVLPGAGRVLGEDGAPIQARGSGLQVERDGTVLDADGNYAGRLLLTMPPEDTALTKFNNGLFTLPAGAGAQQATGYAVQQGVLELSNVNLNQELTNFIATQRAFQSCSSALQIIDGMNQKAASRIASI